MVRRIERKGYSECVLAASWALGNSGHPYVENGASYSETELDFDPKGVC